MAYKDTVVTGIQKDGENTIHEIAHTATNDSGNIELGAYEDEQKLNLVSKTDIQIKPGDDSLIQLDVEANSATGASGDPDEVGIKMCNGSYDKSTRVVSAKINVAEVVIDNQKANTVANKFDIDKIKVLFRTNKWKGDGTNPKRVDNVGPVDTKLLAKSFDIRCHGTAPGGGIALQPSGCDTDLHENKIKFESSRISSLDDAATYCYEGGKGLEFGTFNNEHTSLFTKDYRFKGDAYVYGVTRDTPTLQDDKFDYPTQGDDFKDVLDEENKSTWNGIISAGIEGGAIVISKKAAQKVCKGKIINMFPKTIYYDTDNKSFYFLTSQVDTVYSAVEQAVVFSEEGWPNKAKVYTDAECTSQVTPSTKLILTSDEESGTIYWAADVNSSSELKKFGSEDHAQIKGIGFKEAHVNDYEAIEPNGILWLY